jgi:ribosome-binding ATPase YchF (GTP1/OBG family)
MSSLKQIKQAEKIAGQSRLVVADLQALVKDIDRCERMMTALKTELATVNSKYQGPRDTRQDIAYLTALLDCAKKKLAWEKTIASLQKRTPEILNKMMSLINDPQNPPPEETRNQMLGSLQAVQSAMERLQQVKIE